MGGGLHIIFISVDGEDAAFDLCVIQGNKCSDPTTAYCKKYVSCGVESLEQMEINRYMIGEGICEINLLGNADYKKHFGAKGLQSASYTVFS